MDTTLIQLKAQAYDLYTELEQSQQKVNEYTQQVIVPLRDKLIEVNKSIHERVNSPKEVGGGNISTQVEPTQDIELAQEI